MTHGSLFSGIGGFDLAAQRVGFVNLFQVELDTFCQKVLTKNFPDVKKYLDIKDFDGTEYRGKVDIISGGFPCQPFSKAGKRKGNKDERALFPEMLRVIREAKPKWILAENVGGILSIHDGEYFEEICASLESEGYAVQSFIIPACAVNAPHKRDRVWLIANTNSNAQCNNVNEIQSPAKKIKNKMEGEKWQWLRHEFTTANKYASNPSSSRCESGFCSSAERETWNAWRSNWYEVATKFCRVGNGLPDKLYKLESSDRVGRLKSLGNSIVPQIAEIIFITISNLQHQQC